MSHALPDIHTHVYTVAALNREVRELLEGTFPPIWVEGELSNVARPASGHLYFSLKDAEAQIRCAMFRNRNQGLTFQPKSGEKVLVRARVGLYAPRGDFQLIVDRMEPAGAGALRQAFEALKAKLDAEGLFAEERKRPLPTAPRRLGVITSPTGAAIHDVLTVLARRCPWLSVLVYPVPVQGEGAAEQIGEMIRLASERAEVDALLLTRGGGSLEDLWAFNEEPVARAIAECTLPLVSAVGHEVDVTIADFVADRRAPTPSAAAEMLSPDGAAWARRTRELSQRLIAQQTRQLAQHRERHGKLSERLLKQHPRRRLQERSQRVDELEMRLTNVMRHRIQAHTVRYNHLATRFDRQSPRHLIETLQKQTQDLRRRLTQAAEHMLEPRRQRLASTVRALEAVSPLATLSRGYAIVKDEQGNVLRDAASVTVDTTIEARLGRGRLTARVETVFPEED